MNFIINTIEGAIHQLRVQVTNEVSLSEFTVYGAAACGCSTYPFEIVEKNDKECIMHIPALNSGIYNYQLFVKQIASNKEFLVLEGKIIVDDRVGNSSCCALGNTTIADIAIDGDTVEVNVTIDKGAKGDKGDKGDAGVVDYSILEDYATLDYVDAQMATVENTVQQVIENTKPDNIRRIEDYYDIDLSSYSKYVVFNENGGIAAYEGIQPNYSSTEFYYNNTCEVIDLEKNPLPSEFLGYDYFTNEYNRPTTKVVKNVAIKTNYRITLNYSDGSESYTGEALSISNFPNLTSFYIDGLPRNTVDARWSYEEEYPFILSFSGLSLDEVTVLADKNSKKIAAIHCSGTPIKKLNISEDATLELVDVKMDGTKITEWNFDLSLVKNGSYMFNKCSNLTSFSGGDLSSLTNGSNMFYDCPSLTSFSSDLSSLTNGNSMFYDCSSLTSFSSDLSSLTNGNSMFYDCSSLTSFSSDLSSLTNGNFMFYDCSSLTSFSSDLSSLTNGNFMFYNTNLTSFSSDLSSLTDGSYMFQKTNLETWNIPMPNLKDCYNMFRDCKNLKRITLDMSSATGSIGEMFWSCNKIEEANITGLHKDVGLRECRLTIDGTKQFLENLETTSKNTSNLTMTLGVSLDAFCDAELRAKYGWNSNNKKFQITAPTGKTWEITLAQQAFGNFTSDGLSDLVNGSSFCSNSDDLISWYGDLSSLTNGSNMFYDCSNLTSFSGGDLSSLTNGSYMFYDCSNLTSFSGGDLSSLTDGSYMFNKCSNLTSFSGGDLSSLTNGSNMFYDCSNLTSFSGDLSSLTNGNFMFYNTNLTSFDGDLSSLTAGSYMFQNCSSLTSFSSDLSSLTSGYAMFHNCYNLTSFDSDLSSLTSGDNMFSECNLDAPSVERILTTIKERSSYGSIYIGIKSSAIDKVREITGLTGTITTSGYTYIGNYRGWNLYIKATSND